MNALPGCARMALCCFALLFSVESGCSHGGADDLEPDETVSCEAPLVACAGRCIDPRTATCTTGCKVGYVKCDGQCIDPLTDATHCGARSDCAGGNAGAICQPSATRCGAMTGALCQAGQCLSSCAHGMQSFGVTMKVETFALPSCVTEIKVNAFGAQGGNATTTPGKGLGGMGARVEGSVCVPPSTMLSIVVGEQPPGMPYPSGGGGASYIAIGSTPLFVAGGGGGGYNTNDPGGGALTLATMGKGAGGHMHNNGGGGGGFTDDGEGASGSGGQSFLHGAAGGREFPMSSPNCGRGGFGGGGGASESGTFNAGGGGGYDGGDCGNGQSSTGGTSFMAQSVVNPTFTPNTRTGPGSVEISW